MNMLTQLGAPNQAAIKAKAEQIRKDPNLVGERAYEAHRALLPRYHDGTARPAWNKCSDIVRWSWNRPGRPS